jgi:hypothetical protein
MPLITQVPPLHAAIWEGSAVQVREILDEVVAESNQAEDESPARSRGRKTAKLRALLEARDVHGNTALHLATRIVQPAQRAIIQMLLVRRECGGGVMDRAVWWTHARDFCLRYRNMVPMSAPAIPTAGRVSMTRHSATTSSCSLSFFCKVQISRLRFMYHEPIISNWLGNVLGERQLWSEVEEYQDDFLDALERLPDFEVEIFVEAYSWIPGVSKMLPSQTNRILKRGSQLRVDSSMKGLERFNLNHGNMSHIFTGRADGGKAYMLNHDTKRFYDITSAVNGTSSLSKIDLGIHMLLTKELSATSIDSSNLTFTKLKDVKEIKTKQKSGSTKRASPWTGTKYEMKNVSATFAFRNPVNPKRENRKFAEEGIGAAEAAFGVIGGYVNELAASTTKEQKRSNARSMMDTSVIDDEEPKSSPANGAGAGTDQEQWLPKGQTMEMHLDVVAGDDISWSFSCNSKEYSFVATSYHDAIQTPVVRCGAAKNATITGSHVVENSGSFVLKWLNTQKGFTLDKKGIKIMYKVKHARPPASQPSSGESTLQSIDIATAAATTVATPAAECDSPSQDESNPARTSDLEICQRFQRLDHMPNPMTVVMPFSEYFSDESKLAQDEQNKQDSNPLTAFFKRSTNQGSRSPASASSQSVQPFATVDGNEYRNTFRNLTLLPTPKRFHKNFEAKVFMAEDFPVQTKDFLPVIEFLSKTGDQVENMAEFFRMVSASGAGNLHTRISDLPCACDRNYHRDFPSDSSCP